MTLQELISRLNEMTEDECIFAHKPWTASSEAITASLTKDHAVPPHLTGAGYEYFLEIDLAKEVAEVLADQRENDETKLKLLVFYAENDAYPDWVYER